MAGKHRQAGVGERVKLNLRIPAALRADLDDAALDHRHSLNEEILLRLLRPSPDAATMRRLLLELEPLASDPKVPIDDVTLLMDLVNPYRGRQQPTSDADEAEPGERELDALDIDRKVQWLNPSGSWFTGDHPTHT